jgi:DNA-binding CsgD family transcriptional regulator
MPPVRNRFRNVCDEPGTMSIRKDPSTAPVEQAATPPTGAAPAEFSLDNTTCLVVEDDSPLGRALLADAADHRLGQLDLGGRHYAVYARPPARAAAAEPDPLAALTARELQIVHLVCHGCVNKQIADRLRISEYTVKTYLKQIFCKLNVHSRSAMVYRCAAYEITLQEARRALTHAV